MSRAELLMSRPSNVRFNCRWKSRVTSAFRRDRRSTSTSAERTCLANLKLLGPAGSLGSASCWCSGRKPRAKKASNLLGATNDGAPRGGGFLAPPPSDTPSRSGALPAPRP
eukprot:12205584-Prorocentrum_lima.AAC.1